MKLRLDPSTPDGSIADRARSAILEAILDRRFGARLPPEEELAVMLGVSRTSVRDALEGLETRGLIRRRRSIGTTVNANFTPAALALDRLIGFDWLLRESGHRVHVEASWTFAPTPQSFLEAFSIAEDVESCVFEKTFFADGAPAIGIVDAIPAKNLVRRRFRKNVPSLFEFSRLYCHQPIDFTLVRLTPMVAGADGTHLASIAEHAPFLRLFETHYAHDSVLGWSIIDVNNDYVVFDVARRH
jgi:GntR family transcriptional regulator